MTSLADIAPGTWTLDVESAQVHVGADSFLLRTIPVDFRLLDADIEIGQNHETSSVVAGLSGPKSTDQRLDVRFDAEPDDVLDGIVRGHLVVADHHVPLTFTLADITTPNADDLKFTATAVIEKGGLGGAIRFLPSFIAGRRFTITIDARARRGG